MVLNDLDKDDAPDPMKKVEKVFKKLKKPQHDKINSFYGKCHPRATFLKRFLYVIYMEMDKWKNMFCLLKVTSSLAFV